MLAEVSDDGVDARARRGPGRRERQRNQERQDSGEPRESTIAIEARRLRIIYHAGGTKLHRKAWAVKRTRIEHMNGAARTRIEREDASTLDAW